jgi:aspartyl-tRNA(Asn)/glutamyl-tRNA(Gln) amidotransferase subunit A
VTAAEIAGAVRGRTVRARSIVAAALARIAAHDPELNAFTSVFAERALARAESIDAAVSAGEDPGPLAGVPFAAKNLFDVAGVVTRAGAKVTASDPPAARDADAIAALERRGAVLVGATNMDEFAYGFVTENAHDGATHNPHDRTRIAGGSSGGSAAAVAAELVPLALASDTNGSIRVPAALCGIFGIRPTYGTISTRGAYPFVNSLDTIGPFARTAADLTAAYAALAPAGAAHAGPLTGRRCARLGGYFGDGLLPAARRAVDVVCAALETSAVVELAHARQAREAAFLITAAEAGELHAQRLRRRADEYDPATRDRLIAGALMPASWYVRAQRFRSFFQLEIAAAFASYDLLVAAATPYPAPAIGQRSIVIDGVDTEIRPNVGVFTQPITLAGVPVVTVPIVEREALPVGVQLIGRPGSESFLLALAEELERLGVAGAGAVPVFA